MSTKMRYFLNKVVDYTPDTSFSVDYKKLTKDIKDNVFHSLEKQKCTHSGIDGGLYVGTCGNAYTLYHLSKKQRFAKERDEFLRVAADTLKVGLDIAHRTKSRDPSDECAFLLGKTGIYAVGAAVFHARGEDQLAEDCIQDYIQAGAHCASAAYARFGGDELFVGRAGYVCGALWLNREFKRDVIPEDIINAMCRTMVDSGRQYSTAKTYYCSLVYSYYKTEYIGAAHGLCSILQMLLCCESYLEKNKEAEKLIKKSVDFLVSIQTPGGNFPCDFAEIGSSASVVREDLVHWCHGAPGVFYVLLKAFYRWHEPKYLEAAEKAANLIWEKGLLKKGPGICHGVAGNGYVFLYLYKTTKNPKYHYRANEFANFLYTDDFKKSNIPDAPHSLYEGYAGTMCYLADVMEPETAAFPFFEIN
ncbi:LanC-like protein 3 homolog [Nesidiocoris tenuis]|uniref:LanC-like protein 3 homolog n=1 Tax=Nesidiocoris tenuis TaxID=355587 RepID=A0ABN7ANV8_9HEMI|nr:LanC-like protein 3 homolog [Nesidiocoris tenuis]